MKSAETVSQEKALRELVKGDRESLIRQFDTYICGRAEENNAFARRHSGDFIRLRNHARFQFFGMLAEIFPGVKRGAVGRIVVEELGERFQDFMKELTERLQKLT